MIRVISCCCFFGFSFLQSIAQELSFSGIVTDRDSNPLIGASISYNNKVTSTDSKGEFRINANGSPVQVTVSFVGFQTLDTLLDDTQISYIIILDEIEAVLDEVQVSDNQIFDEIIEKPNAIDVDPVSAANIPSAFGDFSRVLVTLPGVSSNNELSSGYSVRGGNFDENLVYVNDIPVYRPFLSNAGQQEGMNFINPLLVKDISFYAGGWESKYGDKLSSNLLIEYKDPSELEGQIEIGLLGGSAYFGNSTRNQRVSYVASVRHRDSQYLLNSLEVEGQYFPRYTDVQSLLTFDLTKKTSSQVKKTELGWLLAYSRNRYLTLPESQVTEFGSVTRNLRIQTAFEGREQLNYDTYQTGARLVHRFSNKFNTSVIGSLVYTNEREDYEVEGAYRLCDVDNNPGSNNFDECVIARGIGSQFEYGRNQLEAIILNGENRYEWLLNENNAIEAGIGISHGIIEDQLNEYAFNDSSDFASITYSAFNELEINYTTFHQYVQWENFSKDSIHVFNAGLRSTYWQNDFESEFFISPRFQYQLRPKWKKPVRFNFSLGLYNQPPFYRELRNRQGDINQTVISQKSIHVIGGYDRFFKFWNRPFLLSTQVYYKYLMDLIPYEIDNVRLRYFAENNSTGYSTGFDIRLNGEFIPGTQSWFSLGYLKSNEFIPNDDRGAVRRPLDQRINLGVYFEDYMSFDETLRIYVNLVFGSGYPVGPPGSAQLRNVFSGDEYYRADIGLSKEFFFHKKFIEKLAARIEVLNALGADNTLSYTWVQDITGTSFAIPNSLSARFFNVKLIANF